MWVLWTAWRGVLGECTGCLDTSRACEMYMHGLGVEWCHWTDIVCVDKISALICLNSSLPSQRTPPARIEVAVWLRQTGNSSAPERLIQTPFIEVLYTDCQAHVKASLTRLEDGSELKSSGNMSQALFHFGWPASVTSSQPVL